MMMTIHLTSFVANNSYFYCDVESVAHCFLSTASISEQMQRGGRKTHQCDVCSPTDAFGTASTEEFSERHEERHVQSSSCP